MSQSHNGYDAKLRDNRLRGLRLQLLMNVARPESNHWIANDPGKHAGVFEQPIGEVEAVAVAKTEAWRADVAQTVPHIKRAAQMLFAALQSHPDEMLELYELMLKGAAATETEQRRIIDLSHALFDSETADTTVDNAGEKDNPSRTMPRRRAIRLLLSGAGLAGAGALYTGAKGVEAVLQSPSDTDKTVTCGAVMAVAGTTSLGLAFAAWILHDEQATEAKYTRRAADRERSAAEESVHHTVVDMMVFGMAQALFRYEMEHGHAPSTTVQRRLP